MCLIGADINLLIQLIHTSTPEALESPDDELAAVTWCQKNHPPLVRQLLLGNHLSDSQVQFNANTKVDTHVSHEKIMLSTGQRGQSQWRHSVGTRERTVRVDMTVRQSQIQDCRRF